MPRYRTRNVSSDFDALLRYRFRLIAYSTDTPLLLFFDRNELLTQYPELADELEEEIKRMEEENSEKLAHVEELKNQISEDETNANPEVLGTAFTGREKVRENENDDGVGNEVENDELVMSEEVPIDEPIDDFISADEGTTPPTPTEDDAKDSSTSYNNTDDMPMEEDTEEDADADAITNVGTDIESPDTSADKEDLTLSHLAIESLRVLMKNAQDDVKRIVNLAIPVLQPLLNAGDVAWHQMKSLLLRARELYEAYKATNVSPSEGTEVAQTCDDATSA